MFNLRWRPPKTAAHSPPWRQLFRRLALVPVLPLLACSETPDPRLFEQAWRPEAKAETEWRHYLGDPGFSHASELAQINSENVHRLEEVWRYHAGGEREGGMSQMQCNPLIVHGILYCSSPEMAVFALNAASGEELWRFSGAADADAFAFQVNRGLSYWQDGVERRIFFSSDSTLFALNARNGKPVVEFGDNGRVDLHTGLPAWAEQAQVILTTPGTIYKDLLIVGSRVSEMRGAAPGHVRAFDVRSGALRWMFRTIPAPGTFGADTWPEQALAEAGGANSWAGIAVDHERGMAFVPTGSASFDFYGGDRIGDNLFANSLVALNAATGERIWHYQFVRHDVWDRDLPAPPNLITLPDGGAGLPAVAQATKTGHIFLFHRETGELLAPIEEYPVLGEALPGEQLAASQPLPRSPPPFANTQFSPSTRNPAVAAYVAAEVAQLDPFALYRAPGANGAVLYPGMDGGAEWGGMAYDEELNYLYVNANEVPYLLSMMSMKPGQEQSLAMSYVLFCSSCHGGDLRGDGRGVPSLRKLWKRMGPLQAWRLVRDGGIRMPAFDTLPWYLPASALLYVYTAGETGPAITQTEVSDGSPVAYINAGYQRFLDQEGLPASEPPWGTLTAMDLNKGAIAWRVVLGDYPQLLAQGVSGLGSENYGGPLITAGDLLFIAATPDRMFRAYDKHSGELLWSAELSAAGFATPSTYAVDGRQYVVIAAGGGKLGEPTGSDYIAFALPEK